jgi:hypothetical protein
VTNYPTLICSSEEARAKAFQWLEGEQDSIIKGVDYSITSLESSKNLNLSILSGKMLRALLAQPEDLIAAKCTLSFPNQITMCRGNFSPVPTLDYPKIGKDTLWSEIEETANSPELSLKNDKNDLEFRFKLMLGANASGDILAYEYSEVIGVVKSKEYSRPSSLHRYNTSSRTAHKRIEHRIFRDGIAGTLVATHLHNIQKVYAENVVKDKSSGKLRLLSSRERDGLMGWDKDHTKIGVTEEGEMIEIPYEERHKMTGNGITPVIVEHLFEQIWKVW